MKLLYAEDEPALSEAVTDILTYHKYIVDAVYNGNDALDYAESGQYDGIILDIMMPGLSGTEVLKRLREENIMTPVMLLTAKTEVEDRIKVDVSSGSKISLSGKAPSLELSGKGTTAKVDASALKTGKAIVALTGVSADVSPVESIELDLGRGAEVSFSGDPSVNIVKIQSASVLRKQ